MGTMWSGRAQYNGGHPDFPRPAREARHRVLVEQRGIAVQRRGVFGGLMATWSDEVLIPAREIVGVRQSQTTGGGGFGFTTYQIEVDVERNGRTHTAVFLFWGRKRQAEVGAFYGAVNSLLAGEARTQADSPRRRKSTR